MQAELAEAQAQIEAARQAILAVPELAAHAERLVRIAAEVARVERVVAVLDVPRTALVSSS